MLKVQPFVGSGRYKEGVEVNNCVPHFCLVDGDTCDFFLILLSIYHTMCYVLQIAIYQERKENEVDMTCL